MTAENPDPMAKALSDDWLLLIHQIPPEPAYLRVKIGRRLQGVGAIALKNSVYVLPAAAGTREDFHWIAKEVEAGGGEATVCEARFVLGQDSRQITARFREARAADYAALEDEARGLVAELMGPIGELRRAQGRKESQRLRRRLADVIALDFHGAPGRPEAEAALLGLEGHLRNREDAMKANRSADEKIESPLAAYQGRTWVTRTDVNVARMACAWLIKRFIDSKAKFRFVAPDHPATEAGEIRFDMFEAEFTHEGDACSFEVLIARLGLNAPGMTALAELIHDLDLKDGKYDRPETEGLDMMLKGIVAAHPRDEERLARSGALLDDLYEGFRSVAT